MYAKIIFITAIKRSYKDFDGLHTTSIFGSGHDHVLDSQQTHFDAALWPARKNVD
jgi:hypothetical protein